MSVLQKLTEGIVNRDLAKEGHALLSKWEKTGLLEGINSARSKETLAVLLENQAKELLRESHASTMAGGDVEGFAAVAFPIVRRVFGGLIANDLVSVQPMSLPSGLIFFMDFKYSHTRLGATEGDSVYGGGVLGQKVTGGVDLSDGNAETAFYALNNGYSSPTGSASSVTVAGFQSGTVGASNEDINRICRHDPDLSGSIVWIGKITAAATALDQLSLKNLVTVKCDVNTAAAKPQDSQGRQIRRLTQVSGSTTGQNPDLLVVFQATGSESVDDLKFDLTGAHTVTYAQTDDLGGTPAAGANNALGAVVGQSAWGLENNADIPEININVDSVSVTAITKKLKAKWTPELGQDLNAYHNLDAEVELTSVLSEHIALEIDREILEDLVKGATAKTYYWSRKPGKFVEKESGAAANQSLFPDFTGTVSEWYETLVETINDVSAQIHRKTLRGGANFLVVGPEVANLLEFTSGFRANITADGDRGTVGAVKAGSISKKWDVWVDPYFLRNVVLVGRKGGSFLESGYVYAPYVPLQVTPTIFGTEDFVPRKGVMTRYAKKMVRPDMYGLVIVEDMLG